MNRSKKATTTSKIASSKAKLGKYSTTLGNELMNDIFSDGPLLGQQKPKAAPEMKIWKNCLAACGSNAFFQSGRDSSSDLMSTTFKSVDIPTSNSGGDVDFTYLASVDTTSNLSAAVVVEDGEKIAYVWGNGLPGASGGTAMLRVPTLVPTIRNVFKISCGVSHCVVLTESGEAYSYGVGDSGCLGHGGKAYLLTPKRIEALKDVVCVDVSCGGYHTVFIAASSAELTAVTLHRETKNNNNSNSSSGDLDYSNNNTSNSISNGNNSKCPYDFDDDIYVESTRRCGNVYACGQSKAGQLGLPQTQTNNKLITTPTLVQFFQQQQLQVSTVSCGLHHTLFLAVPARRSSYFCTSTVYSTGWGEHGRLGVGDEEIRYEPTPAVVFGGGAPFRCVDISAGEQHSLFLGSDGVGVACGNNSMGQCGVGNPSAIEFCVTPTRIEIPEGLVIRQLRAGGRHSAAITQCGRLLTWGWGEEGQLGNSSERNSYLPRPVKSTRLHNEIAVPVSISCGMSHSLAIFKNPKFNSAQIVRKKQPVNKTENVFTTQVEEQEEEVLVEPPVMTVFNNKPSILVEEEETAPVDEEQEEIILPVIEEPKPLHSLHSAIITEDEEEDDDDNEQEFKNSSSSMPVLAPVRSLRDILQQREERRIIREKEDNSPVKLPDPAPTPPAPTPAIVAAPFELDILPPAPLELEEEEEITEQNNDEDNIDDYKEDMEEFSSTINSITSKSTPVNNSSKVNIYYKEGQNIDKCLVANSAKRAEIRRQKKALASSTS